MKTGVPEYIGREVAPMTAFEIISIFIGILALLMSFGSFLPGSEGERFHHFSASVP